MFREAGTYVVNAKAYYANEVKAVASISIQHASKAEFSSIKVEESSLQTPTKVSLNLIGKKMQDIQTILRDRGDGELIYSKSLTAQHQYTKSGIKALQQTILFNDGSRMHNIATFTVVNPFASQSVALNISGPLNYQQQQNTNLSLSSIPASLPTPLSVTTTFGSNQYKKVSHTPLSQIKLQRSYANAGNKAVASIGEINRCVSVFNQGTIYINTTEDFCLNASRNGTITQFKCDMDKDGIPDICDDDIDGDGIKNLL